MTTNIQCMWLPRAAFNYQYSPLCNLYLLLVSIGPNGKNSMLTTRVRILSKPIFRLGGNGDKNNKLFKKRGKDGKNALLMLLLQSIWFATPSTF